MTKLTIRDEEALFDRAAQIIEAARGHVARSVNSAMVNGYWLVGREIVEIEQRGQRRAGYGEALVQRLAARLTRRFGEGFTETNVKRMRQFYLTFPRGSRLPASMRGAEKGAAVRDESSTNVAVPEKGAALGDLFVDSLPFPPNLSWTHYRLLLKVADEQARAFYEIEAAREVWSSRELERQIAALLFERLARSRDKDKVLALAKHGQQVAVPRDLFKEPFVLEFLDLPERRAWLERDLEQAIIDRLEDFLLELGKGFCFVARQKRLSLDGDNFYVDLVFYNRLLSCFVLVDLKLGKLTHQDLGQMMMYVNWYDRFQRAKHEQPTVGIVLCSDKNDAVVQITLPEDNRQVHAAQYQHYLPTADQLRAEVTRSREEVEHHLHLDSERRARSPKKGGNRSR
jgi:predicted nuclease of restriction endonuclease-like (RecB) superfamily